MDEETLESPACKDPDTPLFLEFALELPREVRLSSGRIRTQKGESIRYDGNQSKTVDD